MNILFVCLGNICRSPAAEGIMRALLCREQCDTVCVDSAGTYGGHRGELPDRRMRTAAQRRGLELTHRSRPLEVDDFSRFDMIVVMDDMNFEDVCEMAPDVASMSKVHRMTEFSHHFTVDYVPDPYYSGSDGFEYVLDVLEDACEGLFAYLNDLKLL